MDRINKIADFYERDEIEREAINDLNRLAVIINQYENQPSENDYNLLIETIADVSITLELIKEINDITCEEVQKVFENKLNIEVMNIAQQEEFEIKEADFILNEFEDIEEEIAPDIEVTKGRILIDLKTDEDIAAVMEIINNQLRRQRND